MTRDQDAQIAGVTLEPDKFGALSFDARNGVEAAEGMLRDEAPPALLSTSRAAQNRAARLALRQDIEAGDPAQLLETDGRRKAAVRRACDEDGAQLARNLKRVIDQGGNVDDLDRLGKLLGERARAKARVPEGRTELLNSPADPETTVPYYARPRKAARGKRRDMLSGLPADWQVQVLRAADPRDRPWLAVLMLTAVRPGVLLDGFVVAATTPYGLWLQAPGSKATNGENKVIRINTSCDTPIASALANWLTKMGGQARISAHVADGRATYRKMASRHSAATRRAVGRALPLTAHRQQAHADAKASGWPQVEIARLTDKRTADAVSMYATSAQGRRGAMGPVQVSADWPVRPSSRHTPPDPSYPPAACAHPDTP